MKAKSEKILTSGIMDKNELVFICNDERICKKVMELINKAYEQGKKEAFLLMQKALGNCYCGKYTKCIVVEKIRELSK